MELPRFYADNDTESFGGHRPLDAGPSLFNHFLDISRDGIRSVLIWISHNGRLRSRQGNSDCVEFSSTNKQERLDLVGYRFHISIVTPSDLPGVINPAGIANNDCFSCAN